MEAKEKAKQLIENFEELCGELELDNESITYSAIRCTLFSIRETLFALGNNVFRNSKEIEFWNEVQKEVRKYITG
jgi:hypothetical protein